MAHLPVPAIFDRGRLWNYAVEKLALCLTVLVQPQAWLKASLSSSPYQPAWGRLRKAAMI